MPVVSPAAIGVDVGTTNTKVVLAGFGDGSVREERVRTFSTPLTGIALRDAVLSGIAEVAAGEARRVQAIGIASMAETGAVVGPDGEPRGDLLRWNRAGAEDADAVARAADRIAAAAGAEALYAATGVPVPAKSPLAQWRALAEGGDPRLADGRWSGAADLLVAALTCAAVTDHTLAARTMAFRSDADGGWEFDADLLDLAGLTADRFPRIAAPGTPAGALTAETADALGLPAGLPVVAAGHDHAVGAWAAGVRTPGAAADSVGTAEALYRVCDSVSFAAAREQGMSVARTVDGRHTSLLAGNPAAGAFVAFAFAELLPGDLSSASAREDALRDAERIVSTAGSGAGAAFVLPYLRGRQSPAPDPRAVVRAVPGLPDRPGAALVAVLTGLALHLAWMDAEQTRIAGPRRPELAVLGGAGAANDAWWLLKRRLVPGALLRATAAEPVAIGAAMLAAERVAGIASVLPLRAPDEAFPHRTPTIAPADPAVPSNAHDPAAADLLAAFVAAALHHHEETA